MELIKFVFEKSREKNIKKNCYHFGSAPTSSNIFNAIRRWIFQCSRAAATIKLPKDIIHVSCNDMKGQQLFEARIKF